MSLTTPKPLKQGHANLRQDINSIIAQGGKLGIKAKELLEVLSKHFKKEEKFALPPLSLLLMISEGHWEINKQTAIEMAEELRENLLEMKKDHQNINNILKDFKIIAQEENNFKAIRFCRDLEIHVEIEDQVLYPASMLVGHYLKHMK